MKKLLFCLTAVFLFSCASQPYIHEFTLGNNEKMYFFPTTEWNAKKITVSIDFNFKNQDEIPVICNISVLQKSGMPKMVSNFAFYADSAEYRLSEVKTLFVDSRKNLVRVTSLLDQDDFRKLMDANTISLKLSVDNVQYECVPSRQFYSLRSEFLGKFFVEVH